VAFINSEPWGCGVKAIEHLVQIAEPDSWEAKEAGVGGRAVYLCNAADPYYALYLENPAEVEEFIQRLRAASAAAFR